MPYIVTKRMLDETTGMPGPPMDRPRAVATLDEAREYVAPLLGRAYPYGPVGNRAALRGLDGFGPLPLPDGTMIEAREVTWDELTADYDEGVTNDEIDAFGDQIIAAYNAAQEGGE